MVIRGYWLEKIKRLWQKSSIVWLSGVRRIGKTSLAKQLSTALYLNCDLPNTREALKSPENFLRSVSEKIVLLDEVHQLEEPSELLKIAADEYPELRLLATGSSTLAATNKFQDSLTGRKRNLHLLPVLARELGSFGIVDVKDRLLRGGLPQNLLSPQVDLDSYSEWLDSYFARDVQELFKVEKRHAFIELIRLLLNNSGGLLDIGALAAALEVSRPTVTNYLNVLEVTHAIYIVRPYHRKSRAELVKVPKIYGFDTGFVAFSKGWDALRSDDCGVLWEQLVLETLLEICPGEAVQFWRDKQKREVDFVVPRKRGVVDCFEAKWSKDSFKSKGLQAFRVHYPLGRNFVVAADVIRSYQRDFAGMPVEFIGIDDVSTRMAG